MLLQLEGTSVRFGGVEALSRVDLELAPGQALGLVGANGCGKTTLFNAVTGVVRPSEGRIVFLGRDITRAAAHDIARAGIARTFQTVRLFATMTVADNVARVDEAGGEGSVELALEQTGLAQRRNVLAGELSLVEQRRLEIARALARAPRLLLMDEPTSGLSPQETEDMIAMLASKVLPGRAAIVAEHKAHVLAALCPAAVLLDQGRKVKQGPPDDLLAGAGAAKAKREV
ncbi:MAG TPA: ATP-binding cassette domain-containing protein, partial [Candidatus Limnocylindrales bacterium]